MLLKAVWSAFDIWRGDWRRQSRHWLCEGERERLVHIGNPTRSDQFLAGRLLARQLLAEVSGAAPEGIALAAAAPTEARDSSGALLCHLSISHSGQQLLVALGAQPLGVDCEQLVARRNWREIATQYFSAAESRWLLQLPPRRAEREFLKMWTAKEALSKCAGVELGQTLAQMAIVRDRISWPRGMVQLGCWSAALSGSLQASLVSRLTAAAAPAQLECEYRAQPQEVSNRLALRLIADRA